MPVWSDLQPSAACLPLLSGGGMYRGKIAKVESYFVSMSSCLPATGAACFLRLLLERHRGFPDLVGETSSLQHDLVHPGVSSRCLLSVWRSSRSTLIPSQTNLLFPFFAWSNKMTNCSTHVYKLEAVKHCMHQTGAFSFLYLSASCRWTAFCWLWNYWFGVRKTLRSEPEKHHGHTDKSTFCSHSATSVQNPFWV